MRKEKNKKKDRSLERKLRENYYRNLLEIPLTEGITQ